MSIFLIMFVIIIMLIIVLAIFEVNKSYEQNFKDNPKSSLRNNNNEVSTSIRNNTQYNVYGTFGNTFKNEIRKDNDGKEYIFLSKEEGNFRERYLRNLKEKELKQSNKKITLGQIKNERYNKEYIKALEEDDSDYLMTLYEDKDIREYLLKLLKTDISLTKYLFSPFSYLLFQNEKDTEYIFKREFNYNSKKFYYNKVEQRKKNAFSEWIDYLDEYLSGTSFKTLNKEQQESTQIKLFELIFKFNNGALEYYYRFSEENSFTDVIKLSKHLVITDDLFNSLINSEYYKKLPRKMEYIRTIDKIHFIRGIHELKKDKDFSYKYMTLSTLHNYNFEYGMFEKVLKRELKESTLSITEINTLKENILRYLLIKISEQPIKVKESYNVYLNPFYVPNHLDKDIINFLNLTKKLKEDLNYSANDLFEFMLKNKLNKIQQNKFIDYLRNTYGTRIKNLSKLKEDEYFSEDFYRDISSYDLSVPEIKLEVKKDDVKTNF